MPLHREVGYYARHCQFYFNSYVLSMNYCTTMHITITVLSFFSIIIFKRVFLNNSIKNVRYLHLPYCYVNLYRSLLV